MPLPNSHSGTAHRAIARSWPLTQSMQVILEDLDWNDLAQSCCDEIEIDPGVCAVWALRWSSDRRCEQFGCAGTQAILSAINEHHWCRAQDGELLTLALASPLRHLPPKHLLPSAILQAGPLSQIQDIILIPVLEQDDQPWTFILMLRQPLHTPHELAQRLQELWDMHTRTRQRHLISRACDQAGNAMFITDLDGDIVWINQAFTRLTGYTPAQALGRNPRFLKSGEQSDAYYRQLWQTISSAQVWSSESVDKDRHDNLYKIRQTISPVIEAGQIAHYLAVHDDVSQRKNLERIGDRHECLENPSGLLTALAFHDAVAEHLRHAERSSQTFALVRFKLNNFSSVHESLNPDDRPVLLHEIGTRIRKLLPTKASAGYLGKGDFALCLPLGSPDTVENFMQAVQMSLNRAYPFPECSPHFRISVGIALYPESAQAPDALWRLAGSARDA